MATSDTYKINGIEITGIKTAVEAAKWKWQYGSQVYSGSIRYNPNKHEVFYIPGYLILSIKEEKEFISDEIREQYNNSILVDEGEERQFIYCERGQRRQPSIKEIKEKMAEILKSQNLR